MKKASRPLFVRQPLDGEYLIITLLLLAVGLLMLLSASYPSAYYETGNPYYYLLRQLRFAALGIFLLLLVGKLDYHWWKHFAVPLILLSLFLLGAVLVPSIGALRNNARRWIIVAGISFQPSELAKLAIIVDFSASIAKKKDKMLTFRDGILPYVGTLLIFAGLLMLEPHLSGTILVVMIGASLMYAGGIRKRWILIGIAVVVFFAWLFISGHIPYGQNRIAMWQDPFIDARGDGYQLAQSEISIGSGGLFGVGLGKSRQKYLYLPEEHNDFIFSVICEEVGLVGATLIMLTFSLFTIRGYTIARHAKDNFGALLATGVTTHFALQTFMNIAVVTGLLPTTGVSLPFFSYGGTALVLQLIEVGIVLSVSRQCKKGAENETNTADSHH